MAPTGTLSVERGEAGTLCIRLAGAWQLEGALPPATEVERALAGAPRRLTFDARGLGAWDSALVTFLMRVIDGCARRGVDVDPSGLPEGVRRLIALATAVPESQGARSAPQRPSLLARAGIATTAAAAEVREFVGFVGEATLALGRFMLGRARYRRVDLVLEIQEAGARALPIVTLISFLIGLIMAFVGATALRQFGAGIYVADTVAIAMTREMGAMMTAIIMAGRTGSAYAAQLGTMNVSQEIDALTTMGLPPIDFLVLPRLLALCIMMPLLAVYADFVGMIGGAVVATGMLDLTPIQYWEQTKGAIDLTDFGLGVAKAAVFGVLVALSGCLEGIRAGRSASAVGDAATKAVVSAIVYIIVADGIFAVACDVLGI